MRIGFIGLGIMGKPMAKNVLKGGHELVVNDHHRENEEKLAALGARVASTAREVAAQSDLVITMLPNSPQVEEVALGPNGILTGAHKGLAYIDMSSIAPLASRKVYEAARKQDVPMLDAPVSGGEPKAIDGSLSVMVGGDKPVFEQFEPVLKTMASSVTYVGGIGAGNIAKLANQAIVAVNIAVLSEALVLAQKSGVDPKSVFEAIRGGLAGSTVMNAKAPMMLAHDFRPGFRINLHIKDLNNVLETGHKVGAALPMTSLVREMMTALAASGHETEDHSALLRIYEDLAKTQLEGD